MRKNHRKIFAAFLAFTLLFTAAACGKKGRDESGGTRRSDMRNVKGDSQDDGKAGKKDGKQDKDEKSGPIEGRGKSEKKEEKDEPISTPNWNKSYGEEEKVYYSFKDEFEPALKPGWYGLDGEQPAELPRALIGFSGVNNKTMVESDQKTVVYGIYLRDNDTITMDYADKHFVFKVIDESTLQFQSDQCQNLKELGIPDGNPKFILKKDVYDESFGELHYGPLPHLILYEEKLYVDSYLPYEGEPSGEEIGTAVSDTSPDSIPNKNLSSNIKEGDVKLVKGEDADTLYGSLDGSWHIFRVLAG